MNIRLNLVRQLHGLILFGTLVACSDIVEVVPFTTAQLPTRPVTNELTTTAQDKVNAPTRIVAKKIKLDAHVVKMGWTIKTEWGKTVSEWQIPFNEAGWHINSAQLGEDSNVVISGHNNSMGGRVFANLEQLEPGDEVTLWDKQARAHTYQVSDKKIVRALFPTMETEIYLQTVMEPTATAQLTLITCWPNWSNTHRLIITAKIRD